MLVTNLSPTSIFFDNMVALKGMTKWENNFIEEDIDLHVFLTLDDDDLKKIGNIFF